MHTRETQAQAETLYVLGSEIGNLKAQIDRRNNPPMPLEEYLRRELQDFAAKFAICMLAALIFAGIVYPWKRELAQVPFWLMFLGGAWLLTTRRAK